MYRFTVISKTKKDRFSLPDARVRLIKNKSQREAVIKLLVEYNRRLRKIIKIERADD